MRLLRLLAFATLTAVASAAPAGPVRLDKNAEKWVERTLKTMTLDEQIGQLLVPSFESAFISTDSDGFDALAALVRDYHVGGFHVFGASEPAPGVLSIRPTAR